MTHEKNHIIKESRKNQNKMLDNTDHGGSRVSNESRPKNGMHDESSSFLSRDSSEDTGQEKMKLLRMIRSCRIN